MSRTSRPVSPTGGTSSRPGARNRRHASAKRPGDRSLRLEPLEDRRLLATVSTLSDVVDGNFTPGNLSLREAIANAVIGEVISFSVTGTIQLTNVNHAGEIAINKSLTIQGPGANLLTIRAHRGVEATVGDGSRIFGITDFGPDVQSVVISGLTLTGGDVNGKGGAIFSDEHLTINSSVITGNATSDVNGNSGGGIFNSYGSLSVLNSTFSNNHSGDGGGAVFASGGTTSIVASTLSGNTARFSGGAIFNDDGPLTLLNSTVSGNSAGYAGGGLLNIVGTANVAHVTITANTAPNGMGSGIASVGNADTHTNVISSIVSENAFNDDLAVILGGSNSFTSLGYNLVGGGNGNGVFTVLYDQRDVISPLLGPLAHNGGPTQTHALLPGSPAINKGNYLASPGLGGIPTYDQRGAPSSRVMGGVIDVGAYESDGPLGIVVDSNIDELDGYTAPGQMSLREAIKIASDRGLGETITFVLPVGSVILLTLDELKITGSVSIQGPGAANLIIDASGKDPDAPAKNGNGIRVFNVDDGTTANRNVSISGLTLTGGDSGGTGGAILNQETLVVADCRIINNSALTTGGGIGSNGSLSVSQTTISLNTGSSGGGGISSAGELVVIDSTINGNSASRVIPTTGGTSFGGGIGIYGGNAIVKNSTISGNSAFDGGGIGMRFSNPRPLTVINCTIVSNEVANQGGGMMGGNPSLPIVLENSLVANNSAPGGGENILGTFTNSFSLLGTVAVGPLQDNGGTTFTHALPAGSPAIDTGNPAHFQAGVGGVPPNDQRGAPYTRVYNGRIDIGAFEVQPPPTLTPSADFDADGDRDGNDFLRWQRGLGLTGALATRANGNADNDSDVDAADLTVWRNTFGSAAIAATEPATAAQVIADAPKALSPAMVDAAMAYQQLLADVAPRPLLRTRLPRGR